MNWSELRPPLNEYDVTPPILASQLQAIYEVRASGVKKGIYGLHDLVAALRCEGPDGMVRIHDFETSDFVVLAFTDVPVERLVSVILITLDDELRQRKEASRASAARLEGRFQAQPQPEQSAAISQKELLALLRTAETGPLKETELPEALQRYQVTPQIQIKDFYIAEGPQEQLAGAGEGPKPNDFTLAIAQQDHAAYVRFHSFEIPGAGVLVLTNGAIDRLLAVAVHPRESAPEGESTVDDAPKDAGGSRQRKPRRR